MLIGDKRKDGIISRIGAPIGGPLTDLNVDCRAYSHDLISLLDQWGDTGSPADSTAMASLDSPPFFSYFEHWG